jgi:hypothetical protein
MLTALAAALVLQTPNTLTKAEMKAGWKLLFDGKTTKGWHNFKATTVGPGWTIADGVLTSSDPEHAGDILSDEKFEWFELTLDFNIAKGQNSGIMYHVADTGDATWHSGPEIQIYDDHGEADAQKTGYLYQLYKPTKEAAKPAGEWNHMRVLISKKKCETDINGVKYYEYVLGSPDFWARVKKSKFSAFPEFAKLVKGSIGIQGDHGTVSFKNVKIRPLKG